MHICFSTHCIALFPLRTPASWRSAKWTRRLFKVWRNWPHSKLICYSERGEPKLSFEYKFVGHTWKLLKLYPTVHAISVFLHTVLHCFHWEHLQVEGVRSAHGGSLRYLNFEFGQFLHTLKSLRVHFALLQLAGVLSGNNTIQCVEKQICMYGWV